MTEPPKTDATQTGEKRKRVVRFEIAPSTMIAIVLVAAGTWVLIELLPVVLVLISALIIVGTVNPAVQWLETRQVRRGTSIAIVFTALFVITVILITLTLPALLEQATNLIDQEPALRTRLADLLDNHRLTATFAESLRNIHYDTLVKSFGDMALALSARILEIFAYSVSAVFLALYLMIDRDRLRGWLFAAVPRSHHMRLSRVLMNLEKIVGGYMRGQVIKSALMTLFMFVLLTACGVPSALAISVFGGIVDVLPYVGVILTMAPAVLAALTQGPVVTVVVLVSMLAYEEFESRVVMPKVFWRTLRLPSAVVLFALLAGGVLGGILGALLSLPFAAAALMLIEELRIKLPGEPGKTEQMELRRWDDFHEQEYQRRAGRLPAEQAAAIAVEISRAHQKNKGAAPQASEEQDKTGNRK